MRETREEVGGLTPLGLRWRGGLLEFWNWESGGSVESVHFVHLFTASGFEGAPSESDEARPAWFKLSEIPYGRMWEDDKLWFPLMLGGEEPPIYGRFVFEGGWRLRRHQLIRLDAVDEGFNACAEPESRTGSLARSFTHAVQDCLSKMQRPPPQPPGPPSSSL